MSKDETLPLFPGNNHRSNNQDSSMNSTDSTDGTNSILYSIISRLLISVLIILLIIASFTVCFIIQPGEIGLVITLGNVYSVPSGLHMKLPLLSRLVIFSAKTQKLEESNNTPTLEGLSVQLDTAM
jgi:hypothetical protein